MHIIMSTSLYNMPCCNIVHTRVQYKSKAEANLLQKGSEDVDEMTTAELNQYLENIAKLIEANEKDAETAAQIVRDSKVTA